MPNHSHAHYFEPQGVIDNTLITGMLGAEEFVSFHSTPGEEASLDVPMYTKPHVTDEQAAVLMQSLTGCENALEYQALTAEKGAKGRAWRDAEARRLHSASQQDNGDQLWNREEACDEAVRTQRAVPGCFENIHAERRHRQRDENAVAASIARHDLCGMHGEPCSPLRVCQVYSHKPSPRISK